jgi:hypothetical protein
VQPNLRAEQMAPDLIGVGAQALVRNADRLGLTWTIALATIFRDDPLEAIYDGDSVPIGMISMIGVVLVGQRVYVIKVPPSGNFICGSPDLATTAAIADPVTATVATSQTTASGTYVDLTTPGPAVTVITGTKALVVVTANLQCAGTDQAWMSFAVSDATTLAASDTRGIAATRAFPQRFSAVTLLTTLTAGSNTFTAKYRTTGGSTGTFLDRDIVVVPQ